MNVDTQNEGPYVFNDNDLNVFKSSGHDSLFDESEIKHGNSQRFLDASKTALEQSNQVLAQIYKILACVSSPSLRPINSNEPFVPEMQFFDPPQRSFLPEDLTADQLKLLELIVDDIKPFWLKARVADILWLRVRGANKIVYARTALRCYQYLPISAETWRSADIGSCWERAYRLSLQISDSNSSADIKAMLITAFSINFEIMNELAGVLSIGHLEKEELNELAELMLTKSKSLSSYIDPNTQSNILVRLWRRLFGKKEAAHANSRNFGHALSLIDTAQNLYSRSSNGEKLAETLFVKSWIHESDGDSRMRGELGTQLGALYSFQDALKSIRKIPAASRETYQVAQKIKILRKKILKSGKNTENHIPRVQVPTGITPEILRLSEKHVGGCESPEEAIFRFTGLYAGPKRTDWIEMTSENRFKFPLSGLFGATHFDEGRVVANNASRGIGNENDNPERIDEDARFNFLRSCVSFVVRGQLQPGLQVILSEHTICLEMMIELARRSSLVPENREHLIGLGLQKGFEFDFPTAVHILAPQLENMVRIMVLDNGGVASTIDQTTSVEKYIALGSLLDKSEAKEALGNDLEFEIRSIFTDKRGPNLRNNIAHGEMDDYSSQSEFCFYAWWMILRILCMSILNPNPDDLDTNID